MRTVIPIGARVLLAFGLVAPGALACRRAPAPEAPGSETAGASLVASPSERRVAVVLGSNVGSGARPALRYAEADAEKMARALVEVGGLQPADVRLVRGGSAADVRRALAETSATLATSKRHHPASRGFLVFYFSGHSDGAALELGRERLAFADLRQSLRGTGAEIRLGFIDACHSGAVIGTKGGKQGPGFDLHAVGLPALSGEAFLSASRADEVALESREIEGSFFTHHLVSGMRGAADADRNNQVSLEELYRHTAAGTRSAAAGTIFGGQTPAYDYRLVGHGDVMMTDLRVLEAAVYVPGGFDRLLFLRQPSGRVEAETGLGPSGHLFVPPGEYVVRGLRDGVWFRGRGRVGPARWVIKTSELARETTSPLPDADVTAQIIAGFRPGNQFPTPLPRTNPYFCEPLDGGWKGCRPAGCFVCAEMLHGYQNYVRNHPNCQVTIDCRGRFFPCSAHCPPPGPADSCDPAPDGWNGCLGGCAVCSPEIAKYPKYFVNHPNCAPFPGRCKATPPGRCGAACPAPGPDDR